MYIFPHHPSVASPICLGRELRRGDLRSFQCLLNAWPPPLSTENVILFAVVFFCGDFCAAGTVQQSINSFYSYQDTENR